VEEALSHLWEMIGPDKPSIFSFFGGGLIPVSAVLRFEVDKDAECCLNKLKDSLWLDKSSSFERIRIYLHVIEGKISGLRLIVPSNPAEFCCDVSHIATLPYEEQFMRSDVKDDYVPVRVKGATHSYGNNHTEVVLLFPEMLEEGKYVLIMDLLTESYKGSGILAFLLSGLRWTYESKNYRLQIEDKDLEFLVGCKRIEMWIVPPYYKHFWKIEPDGSVVRYVEMIEGAISKLQGPYAIPNAGPIGRLAYQWEQEANFGEAGTPSMMSRIKCRFAGPSPLVLLIALASLLIAILGAVRL